MTSDDPAAILIGTPMNKGLEFNRYLNMLRRMHQKGDDASKGICYQVSLTACLVSWDRKLFLLPRLTTVARGLINPYPTAFPYGNGMVLHFYQQQESSTTKTVHKVINKGLKTYV